MTEELHRIYGRARLNDRQINELIGLAHGLIADGSLNQSEAEYLQKWLVANREVTDNPITANLLCRVNAMLADGVLDAEESKELYETLRRFSGGDFELGEILKSCELPLDEPPPKVICAQKIFCFTGTFAFGTRKDCEDAVEKMGGKCGSLNQKTNFLVIGVYATESWKHSSYGLKIEKAVKMKREGISIFIIGETHWLDSVAV
jgi:NAD-dependent DNA ligase